MARAKAMVVVAMVLAALAMGLVVGGTTGYLLGWGVGYADQGDARGIGAVMALRDLHDEQRVRRYLHDQLGWTLFTDWAAHPKERIAPSLFPPDPVKLSTLRKVAAAFVADAEVEHEPFHEKIAACHLQPTLPDPFDAPVVRAKQVFACYDELSVFRFIEPPDAGR